MSTQNRFPTLLLSALLLAPVAAAADPPETPDTDPPPRLELRRPGDRQVPDRESMAAWHRRYRPLAEPVKEALAKLLRARRRYRPGQLEPECRELAEAVKIFRRKARTEEIFPVANAAVDVALKRLYDRLGDAAGACLEDRWGAMTGHLHHAGRHARQARLALRTYGLKP